jgi:mono/diheme cytochrome c family protein
LLTSRVAVGYRINPVELRLRGKNLFLVGLGSYLVNAGGGCNDCHTHPSFAPGGDPFKGETEIINTAQFLAGGRQFGPTTSANITPDENGRPAGLTFEEFEHLLRTGRDKGGEILQVMPWNVYGKMTRFDLRAIYEYLSAIPSLPDNPEPGP